MIRRKRRKKTGGREQKGRGEGDRKGELEGGEGGKKKEENKRRKWKRGGRG